VHVDVDGCFDEVNPTFADALGSQSDLVGHAFTAFVHAATPCCLGLVCSRGGSRAAHR
jgi:hypothetical protein